MSYRVRKVGRTWRVLHVHDSWLTNEDGYVHQVAESSHWSMCMWIATADRTYAQPGFLLVPSSGICG